MPASEGVGLWRGSPAGGLGGGGRAQLSAARFTGEPSSDNAGGGRGGD